MTQLKLGKTELRTLVAAVFYVTDKYIHTDVNEKAKAAKASADWFIEEMKKDGDKREDQSSS